MKTYKCLVCGLVFEVEEGLEPICPKCKAKGDKLVLVKQKKNPYAGTQTEKNLEAAFAGESQARNKYTYFASKAKKEGYEQIAALFLKTADNEKEHAKLWFKELNGIGDTAQNLAAAADGENYEWTDMALPKRQRRKGSTSWLRNSAWWQPLKSTMKSVTVRCCAMWRPARCLRKQASRSGSAATAVISW